MAAGDLPQDGELRLGQVSLPVGQRIGSFGDVGEDVIWATTQAVPDAGRTWLALSDAHMRTGLVPVLLSPTEEFQGFFEDPPSTAELDRVDTAGLLHMMWDDKLPPDDAQDDGPRLVQQRAPFSRDFPGLASREDTPLSPDRLDAALSSLPPARIGLIPAPRPADAIPVIGWSPFDPRCYPLPNPLWIAAVLRSWEDRFSAQLLTVGHGAKIQLLVKRPPRDRNAAQHVAAEHFVFCDECAGRGLRDISDISAAIINAPIWTFWWD
jgi:Domain of unknown function (DUF4253)